jgi:septum formation protein
MSFPTPPRFWLDKKPLVLASTSSTRQSLLSSVGLPFESIASDVDERALEESLIKASCVEVAQTLALAKARAVAVKHPDRYVVGADQVLSLEGERFNKPRDASHAREQLQRLQGKTHTLISAFAVIHGSTQYVSHAIATMPMRALDDAALATYVRLAGDNVTRSVGGYQVEGLGLTLFSSMSNDASTVMGLPLIPLLDYFRHQNVLAF